MPEVAKLHGVTLDCANPAQLAEFYHQLTGMKISYSTDDFASLEGDGGPGIGFQRVDDYQAPQWPGQTMPQQFHLDFTVSNVDDAEASVIKHGGTLADTQPGGDRWRVYLDPAGHPFCLFPAPS